LPWRLEVKAVDLDAKYLELAELAYMVLEGNASPKKFLSLKKELEMNLNM